MTHWIQLAVMLLAIAMAVSGYRGGYGADEFTVDEFGWAVLLLVGIIVIIATIFWFFFSL